MAVKFEIFQEMDEMLDLKKHKPIFYANECQLGIIKITR